MKIDIVCSNTEHPVFSRLEQWRDERLARHVVQLVQRKADLSGGDILFLISCHELIDADTRSYYRAALVIHASDLPEGRGWSPHIWGILAGHNHIPVTLLEAEDRVDSGAVWAQKTLRLEGHELYDEINNALFTIELELMDFAVDHIDDVVVRQQDARLATYLPRRTPEDSWFDPCGSLADQFDLLRIADPDRFPAFFDFRGHRYHIRIEKGN